MDWLALGIYRLIHAAQQGDMPSMAVLDELARLRSLAEHDLAHHLDIDAAFTDAAQYTQTMTNEVLR